MVRADQKWGRASNPVLQMHQVRVHLEAVLLVLPLTSEMPCDFLRPLPRAFKFLNPPQILVPFQGAIGPQPAIICLDDPAPGAVMVSAKARVFYRFPPA